MLTEISAGLNSLKAAKDILQALNGIQSANAVNEVKFNLQSHLLDAQQGLFAAQEAQAALTSRIRELEQRIVEMKDWEAEKGRYQLHDIGRGAMAYVVKPGMENGEPAHWLCVKCFSHGQKSFMQFKGQDRRPGATGAGRFLRSLGVMAGLADALIVLTLASAALTQRLDMIGYGRRFDASARLAGPTQRLLPQHNLPHTIMLATVSALMPALAGAGPCLGTGLQL